MGAGFFDWFRPSSYSRRDRSSTRSRSTARLSSPANHPYSSNISALPGGISYDDDDKHKLSTSSPYTTTPYHTIGATSSTAPSSTNSASVFGLDSGTKKLSLSPTPASGIKYNSIRGQSDALPSGTTTTSTTTTTTSTVNSGSHRQKTPGINSHYQQEGNTDQKQRRRQQQLQQQYQQQPQQQKLQRQRQKPQQQQQKQEILNHHTSIDDSSSRGYSQESGSYPPAPTDTIFSDHQNSSTERYTETLQVQTHPSVFNRSPRRSESFSDVEPRSNVDPPISGGDIQLDIDIDADIEGPEIQNDQPISFPRVVPPPLLHSSSENGQLRQVRSDQVNENQSRITRKGKSKHKTIHQETKLFQPQQQDDHLNLNHSQHLHDSVRSVEVGDEEREEEREERIGYSREGQGDNIEKNKDRDEEPVQLVRRHSKKVNKTGKQPSCSSPPVPSAKDEFSRSASLASSYSPGSHLLRDESFELFVPHHPADRDRGDAPISAPLPLARAPIVSSQKSSRSVRSSRHRAGLSAGASSISPPSSFSSVSTSAAPSSSRSRGQAQHQHPHSTTASPPPLPPPQIYDSTGGDHSEPCHIDTQSADVGCNTTDRVSAGIYTSPQPGPTGISLSRTDTNSFRSSRGSEDPLLPGQGTSKTSKYLRVFGGAHARFTLRSKSDRSREQGKQHKNQTNPPLGPPLHAVPHYSSLESINPSSGNFCNTHEDIIFGTQEQFEDQKRRLSDIRPGEKVLITFIRKTLGARAEKLAIGLMNKSPITSSTNFSYSIHQGTEDSDLTIIRRDMDPNILFKKGVRLLGGGWSNLLLGDRFSHEKSTRQRHELTYSRSACSCLDCLVREAEAVRAAAMSDGFSVPDVSDETGSERTSNMDMLSSTSTTRTPLHSAMANFVELYGLPRNAGLLRIGGKSTPKELEIGSVIRLNLRTSAKLKFTDDVRELFGHLAYTGPISHEDVFRKVTTIGVRYYMFNKGKKERKVYIKGELICLPINVGITKLRTQPLFRTELGATYLLYRKQQVSIYVGELVLEGNSIGSFINTGLRYYIGFGEERGVCPVFPNKAVGKARKLGINELLLHHHMVDDLEVKCI